MTNIIDSSRVRFGPYEVDLHTRELWKFGTRMKLVGQPFEILAVMLSRPGELVTRDELRERLWPGETFVDFNHGLNAAVNKLRDVLSDSADDPKYVETLPRRGYRFIAKVEQGTVEVAGAATASSIVVEKKEPTALEAPPTTAELDPVVNGGSAVPAPRKRRWWPLWVAASFVAAVLLFTFFVSFLKISGALAEKIRKENTAVAAVAEPTKGVQVILVSGGKNEGPQFSPDGKRLAFMSNRTGGGMDIWVSDASGGDPKQLTTLQDAGTPRWSPDGRKIAFDSRVHKYGAILVVDASGGQPRFAVVGNSNNTVPSWSHDGRVLYFASDRTGQYEVWKVAADGGPEQQVTKNGGFAPLESADGKTLYYPKNQLDHPEVWRVPVEGGAENLVSPAIRPGTWASFGLADTGIYFVEEAPGNVAMLSFFDLQSQRLRQLTLLGRFPFWLGVSPDGKRVAFDRVDSETNTSIIELDDFR